MADDVVANPGAGGATFRTLDDGTREWPTSVASYATTLSPGANVLQVVTPANGLPVAQSGTWNVGLSTGSNVIGGVTQSGTWTVSGPLTDTQLRASAVPVSLASTTITGSVAVTGPLTDTQLRATAVPVSLASTTVTGTVAVTQSGTWSLAANQSVNMAQYNGVAVGATNALHVQPGTGASFTVAQATPANLQTSATQVLGSAATRWFTQISDGTNSPAVKAASTAAVAADPAIVVALSPNNNTLANSLLGRVTDGTNIAAVKAASTAAVAADPSQVVSISPNLPVPTQSFINSAATTNATSIKASAGTVYNITASNTGAAAAFVKFYNLAAAPTVGTSVPAFTISVPASGTVTIAPALLGIRFGTGIALAITNLAADTDATAVAAAQVKVATTYI